MTSKTQVVVATLGVAIATMVTGCSTLPPYEEVRRDTRAEMQAFVDTIPAEQIVRISDPPEGDTYPCDGGLGYTGQWTVYTDPSFDIPGWIEETEKDWLADGYTLHDDGVPDVGATTAFFTPDDILLVLSQNFSGADSPEPYIEIMAYGNCGAIPDEQ
jgi:hypothetical protein